MIECIVAGLLVWWMPQSLSCVILHVVFSTKGRVPWLDDRIRPRLLAYLAEVGRDEGCEMLRVGGVQDHVHAAIRMSRVLSLADFMKKVKGASSKWMHSQGRPYDEFAWQAGYGVFSIGASQLGALIAYVDSQEEHHRKKTFQEEFREMLERYGVDYDERYLWD